MKTYGSDMILLHIAREGTVMPEMLQVFGLALAGQEERPGGSLSTLMH